MVAAAVFFLHHSARDTPCPPPPSYWCRQTERDRKQSDYTARVNLRAELMTRHINAKLDALISSSWRRLLESQVRPIASVLAI